MQRHPRLAHICAVAARGMTLYYLVKNAHDPGFVV